MKLRYNQTLTNSSEIVCCLTVTMSAGLTLQDKIHLCIKARPSIQCVVVSILDTKAFSCSFRVFCHFGVDKCTENKIKILICATKS